MTAPWSLSAIKKAIDASVRVFVHDVGHGVLEVSHNTLAVLGLVVVGTAVFAVSRPDLRADVETVALSWLQERHLARVVPAVEPEQPLLKPEPGAVQRATAANPADLNRQQAAVATWLSKRYRVAPEPVSRLVQEAWAIGERAKLEPTLILAIMAIESGFNPFAQSHVGAQGLMQVMTNIHDRKYEPFGGNHAAFDPLTNVRVGVMVLKECIARAGSIEGGLKYYVGAANLPYDGGYSAKVLGEQEFIKQVASGRAVPLFARAVIPPPPRPEVKPPEAAEMGASASAMASPTAEGAASASPAPSKPADPAKPPSADTAAATIALR
jgi:soluble lytic murein transglycosylase-like protein